MKIPFIVDVDSKKETVYDIYSKLLKERIIFIEGEINDEKANLVVSELLYLDSISNDDINIYINSPGGSITAGMAIYDTMNYIKSDCVTIGIGLCASMAAFLLSSGTRGKRCSLNNTEIMIHEPLGGVNGQATEIKIVAERILKIKKKLNVILSRNTKKSLSKIEKDVERDYYMDSDEALKYGIIDKII
ncbi:aTP-dependent Clp protease proteolytic subunit 1 [Clostridium sp. CAG:524]|jgi:ATP-dependent Clp protease protease subunit|nr:aTP-dependent Clp protease proteolytic subunit 1 [Clostridium sp. CAG:524]